MIRRRVVRPKLVSNGHFKGNSISRSSIRSSCSFISKVKLLLVSSKQIPTGAICTLEPAHDQTVLERPLKTLTRAQPPFEMFFDGYCPKLVDVFGDQDRFGWILNVGAFTGKHRLDVRRRHPPFRKYSIAWDVGIENGG